jgi:hypothetical protein
LRSHALLYWRSSLYYTKEQLACEERVSLMFVTLILSLDGEPIEGVVIETDEGLEVEHEVAQVKEMLNPLTVSLLIPDFLAE